MIHDEMLSVQFFIVVVCNGLFHKVFECSNHLLLKLFEPRLDRASCLGSTLESDFFFLVRIHGHDLQTILVDINANNVVKASFEMELNDVKIRGIGEDVDQLVVREEIESWECTSLHLHVVVELLLNFV